MRKHQRDQRLIDYKNNEKFRKSEKKKDFIYMLKLYLIIVAPALIGAVCTFLTSAYLISIIGTSISLANLVGLVIHEEYQKHLEKKSFDKKGFNNDDLKDAYNNQKVMPFKVNEDTCDKEYSKYDTFDLVLNIVMHYRSMIVNMSSEDWRLLFDTVYSLFEEKKMTKYFHLYMLKLAMICGNEEIVNLDVFTDKLPTIFGITDEEIASIKNYIKNNKQSRDINVKKYVKV